MALRRSLSMLGAFSCIILFFPQLMWLYLNCCMWSKLGLHGPSLSLCISCFTTWSSWPSCHKGGSFNICDLLQARTLEEPSYSSERSTLATWSTTQPSLCTQTGAQHTAFPQPRMLLHLLISLHRFSLSLLSSSNT